MKILIKIILVISVFILFLFIIFPSSPLRSQYSKIILSQETILTKLSLNENDCKYQEPTMFDSPLPAAIVCITTDKYKLASDAQKTAVDDMRSVLDKNGWTFSSTESWKYWDIVYHKGARQIHIYPYDWGPGCEGDKCKLFVTLQ